MENYFKNVLMILLTCSIFASCNKESIVEGFEGQKTAIVDLNQTVALGASTNLILQVDGTALSLPISFTITAINATTGTYRIITNSYNNFRWAYETYIRKYNLDEAINGSDFINGGTNYIVSALKTGTNYAYQFNKSCIVNQENYIAFKYTKTTGTLIEEYLGWISVTPKDNQVVFNKFGYVKSSSLKAGK